MQRGRTELQVSRGILRLHYREFKVTPLSGPEPLRPHLCLLGGLLPVTEFRVGLPGMGVVLGSRALVSQGNPAKGVCCWHDFRQLGK